MLGRRSAADACALPFQYYSRVTFPHTLRKSVRDMVGYNFPTLFFLSCTVPSTNTLYINSLVSLSHQLLSPTPSTSSTRTEVSIGPSYRQVVRRSLPRSYSRSLEYAWEYRHNSPQRRHLPHLSGDTEPPDNHHRDKATKTCSP